MWYSVYIAKRTDIEDVLDYNEISMVGDSSNRMNELKYQPHIGDTVMVLDYNRIRHTGIVKKVVYDFAHGRISIFMVSS